MKTLTSKSLVLLALLALSSLPAYAQNGILRVNSFPSGAAVIVDGAATGRVTPANINLPVGPHSVTVAAPGPGWTSDTRTITIAPGSNELNVTLVPAVTRGPQGPKGDKGDPARRFRVHRVRGVQRVQRVRQVRRVRRVRQVRRCDGASRTRGSGQPVRRVHRRNGATGATGAQGPPGTAVLPAAPPPPYAGLFLRVD